MAVAVNFTDFVAFFIGNYSDFLNSGIADIFEGIVQNWFIGNWDQVFILSVGDWSKACERYKMALEDWSLTSQALLDNCLNEIKKVEDMLKAAKGKEDIYLSILNRSPIHNDYQNLDTLAMFKYFLETGRASNLQECMNLFEEEKHWNEIKAGQDRIENTIYFLQNCSEPGRLASEELDAIVKQQQGVNQSNLSAIYESNQQSELSSVAR